MTIIDNLKKAGAALKGLGKLGEDTGLIGKGTKLTADLVETSGKLKNKQSWSGFHGDREASIGNIKKLLNANNKSGIQTLKITGKNGNKQMKLGKLTVNTLANNESSISNTSTGTIKAAGKLDAVIGHRFDLENGNLELYGLRFKDAAGKKQSQVRITTRELQSKAGATHDFYLGGGSKAKFEISGDGKTAKLLDVQYGSGKGNLTFTHSIAKGETVDGHNALKIFANSKTQLDTAKLRAPVAHTHLTLKSGLVSHAEIGSGLNIQNQLKQAAKLNLPNGHQFKIDDPAAPGRIIQARFDGVDAVTGNAKFSLGKAAESVTAPPKTPRPPINSKPVTGAPGLDEVAGRKTSGSFWRNTSPDTYFAVHPTRVNQTNLGKNNILIKPDGTHVKLNELPGIQALKTGETAQIPIDGIGNVSIKRIKATTLEVTHTDKNKTFVIGSIIPKGSTVPAFNGAVFGKTPAEIKAVLPAPPKGNFPFGKVAIGLGVVASGVAIKNTFFPGTPPVENLKDKDGKEIIGKNGEKFPTSRLDDNGKPVAIEYKKDDKGNLILDPTTGAPTEVEPQQAPADPATGTGTTSTAPTTGNTVTPADPAAVKAVREALEANPANKVFLTALNTDRQNLEKIAKTSPATGAALIAAKYADQKAKTATDPTVKTNEERNVSLNVQAATLANTIDTILQQLGQTNTTAQWNPNLQLSGLVTQAQQLSNALKTEAAKPENAKNADALKQIISQLDGVTQESIQVANKLYPNSIPTGSGAAAANPATTDQAQTDTTGQEGQQQQTDAAAPAK